MPELPPLPEPWQTWPQAAEGSRNHYDEDQMLDFARAAVSRALAALEPGKNPVEVLCFGDQEESAGDITAHGFTPGFTLPSQNAKHADWRASWGK